MMPTGDAAVQNKAGAVGFDGRITMELPGQGPIVDPGTEARTIAVQATEGCFGPASFDPVYVPGRVNLTNDEFNAAVMEVNGVLQRQSWFVNCCCPADQLRAKCSELTQRHAAKRVEFQIRTRDGIGIDMEGKPSPDEKCYLLVRQMV
jgi:hypothetical protein